MKKDSLTGPLASLRSSALSLVLFTCGLLFSCAGPYHPFGSEDLLDRIQSSAQQKLSSHSMNLHRLPANSGHQEAIRVSPLAQQFHRSQRLRIKLAQSNKNLRIFYNQKDVTEEALEFAHKRGNQIIIPNFRLSAAKEHDIFFTYKGDKNKLWGSPLLPPQCQWHKNTPIKNPPNFLQNFRAQKEIHYQAKSHALNPNFLAALMATEGASPKASLKKIIAQKIQQVRSIQNYWKKPHHRLLYQTTFQSEKFTAMSTDFILANLKEGPFRLKRALQLRGEEWKKAPFLESRTYSQTVKSYCFDFSHKIVSSKGAL